MFASKCVKCQESFAPNEFFIRSTFHRRYHPDCFRCDHCERLLISGDEYYLHGSNEILCRDDYQQLTLSNSSSSAASFVPVAATAGILLKKEEEEKKKAYGVHTYLHPFGCSDGVKEGIDGMR